MEGFLVFRGWCSKRCEAARYAVSNYVGFSVYCAYFAAF